MAKYVIHRSAQVGAGTIISPSRPAISDYVSSGGIAGGHQSLIHAARNVFYGLAWVDNDADEGQLTAAGNDANINLVSPIESTVEALNTWLETNPDTAMLTVIEGDAINGAWVDTGSHKRRNVLRYLSQHLAITQIAKRANGGAVEVVTLMAANLDATVVSVLTAQQRQRARTWMENRGLTVPNWNSSTTCRQVFQFLLEAQIWPTLKIGLLNLASD